MLALLLHAPKQYGIELSISCAWQYEEKKLLLEDPSVPPNIPKEVDEFLLPP